MVVLTSDLKYSYVPSLSDNFLISTFSKQYANWYLKNKIYLTHDFK